MKMAIEVKGRYAGDSFGLRGNGWGGIIKDFGHIQLGTEGFFTESVDFGVTRLDLGWDPEAAIRKYLDCHPRIDGWYTVTSDTAESELISMVRDMEDEQMETTTTIECLAHSYSKLAGHGLGEACVYMLDASATKRVKAAISTRLALAHAAA